MLVQTLISKQALHKAFQLPACRLHIEYIITCHMSPGLLSGGNMLYCKHSVNRTGLKLCMSRDTFMCLCSQLQPRLKHADTHMRKAIPTKQCLAITLWSLATPAEYRTIAHLFGVGRSTVYMIVQDMYMHC